MDFARVLLITKRRISQPRISNIIRNEVYYFTSSYIHFQDSGTTQHTEKKGEHRRRRRDIRETNQDERRRRKNLRDGGIYKKTR